MSMYNPAKNASPIHSTNAYDDRAVLPGPGAEAAVHGEHQRADLRVGQCGEALPAVDVPHLRHAPPLPQTRQGLRREQTSACGCHWLCGAAANPEVRSRSQVDDWVTFSFLEDPVAWLLQLRANNLRHLQKAG